MREAVQECISTKLLEAKSEDKWMQMVSTAHAQVSGTEGNRNEDLAWPWVDQRFLYGLSPGFIFEFQSEGRLS